MSSPYFRPRKRFDLRPYIYEIGNLLGAKKGFEDNHFLKKIYDLDPLHYRPLYDFHLAYYSGTGREWEFYRHLWQLIESRIAYFKGRDPFASNRATNEYCLAKLVEFQDFLKGIDQWKVRPLEEIMAEHELVIAKQQEEILKLRSMLKELKEFEVTQKAMIQDDHLATFIDLIKQLPALRLPNGRRLILSDHESPYYKMIAKYFSHDGRDIPINTARNYFLKKDDARKGVGITDDKKLFQIVPRSEES